MMNDYTVAEILLGIKKIVIAQSIKILKMLKHL